MSNVEQRLMWNLQDRKEIGKISKSELKELQRLEDAWERQEQEQRLDPLCCT